MVLRLKATAKTRKLLSNKMANISLHGSMGVVQIHFIPCNSSKGRRMHNAWTKESTCCSTGSLTAAKSDIALLFCSMHRGGGLFIVLQSRGVSHHTYSEDMHSRISSS